MADRIPSLGRGDIESLILQFLVRKLVAKSILSPDDVRALLVDAATHLNVDGGEQTPQAARAIVEEDLAPLFLDATSGDPHNNG